MRKFGPPRNQTKYISFERFWWELSKNVIFIKFEPLCQKLWAFMSSFTMTTYQIWSCHVTLAAHFENFYFSPNSILNFRKSCQIWGKLDQEQKSYRQKAKHGVENTPSVLIGLKHRYIRQTGSAFPALLNCHLFSNIIHRNPYISCQIL